MSGKPVLSGSIRAVPAQDVSFFPCARAEVISAVGVAPGRSVVTFETDPGFAPDNDNDLDFITHQRQLVEDGGGRWNFLGAGDWSLPEGYNRHGAPQVWFDARARLVHVTQLAGPARSPGRVIVSRRYTLQEGVNATGEVYTLSWQDERIVPVADGVDVIVSAHDSDTVIVTARGAGQAFASLSLLDSTTAAQTRLIGTNDTLCVCQASYEPNSIVEHFPANAHTPHKAANPPRKRPLSPTPACERAFEAWREACRNKSGKDTTRMIIRRATDGALVRQQSLPGQHLSQLVPLPAGARGYVEVLYTTARVFIAAGRREVTPSRDTTTPSTSDSSSTIDEQEALRWVEDFRLFAALEIPPHWHADIPTEQYAESRSPTLRLRGFASNGDLILHGHVELAAGGYKNSTVRVPWISPAFARESFPARPRAFRERVRGLLSVVCAARDGNWARASSRHGRPYRQK